MPRVFLIFSKIADEHKKLNFFLQDLPFLKGKDKANVMIFHYVAIFFSQTHI